MNHYEFLEVSPVASPEVIRAAYRSLMQRYHPDKNPGDAAAAARASQVVQAYEVLSDPVRRAAYDRQLQAQAPSSAQSSAPRHGGTRRSGTGARSKGSGEENAQRRMRALLSMLFFALIVAGAWGAFSLRKPAAGGAAEPRSAPASPVRMAGELEIKELFAGVSIELKGAGDAVVTLFIPAVGVRVGAKDPEGAVRHLINSREVLAARLLERLGKASPGELLKSEGETYLARIILDALQDKPLREENKDEKKDEKKEEEKSLAPYYGVVEVFFPKGFRVN